mmetsp:Transcript_12934/g.29781  ORF Transcript_12934/g.29781 Transcript_12934/m.29781 type:complete len:97 (-) Transcript_12934:264-554(-)
MTPLVVPEAELTRCHSPGQEIRATVKVAWVAAALPSGHREAGMLESHSEIAQQEELMMASENAQTAFRSPSQEMLLLELHARHSSTILIEILRVRR